MKGDKVAFTGSMNLTASALLNNIKTIECTCSWKTTIILKELG